MWFWYEGAPSIASSSTSVLCSGSALIEFVRSNLKESDGNVWSAAIRGVSRIRFGCGSSMIPFRSSISIARSATAAAMVSNLSGSGDQSILVADAKCDIGCASTPTLAILIFLHSTIVVPVSQNGSRTHALAPNSNRLIYSRTKCGGNESTNRYQSCAARSLDSNRLESPRETGDLDDD